MSDLYQRVRYISPDEDVSYFSDNELLWAKSHFSDKVSEWRKKSAMQGCADNVCGDPRCDTQYIIDRYFAILSLVNFELDGRDGANV